MASDAKWDRAAGGWVAFIDGRKVAVVTTQQLMQNPTPDKLTGPQVAAWKEGGLLPWEPLLPEQRFIHFCSPSMSVDDLRAILDGIPVEA